MIPPEFIDELHTRTDIVEIIEARVTLKKAGQRYVGLCPFHQEKTPSFSVNQEKQFYYCFGCQVSGTALKFLMEHDRMDFISAVEYLAQRVGMKVPQNQGRDFGISQKHKAIYAVLDKSTSFYKEQLRTHESRDRAVSYLKGRQVSGITARDFALGFAPPGWDNLLSYLQQAGYESQLLADAGLVLDKPEEGRLYDRLRDRIIFPIRDTQGRTVAFGGRGISPDAKPKYLNSPETAVFHKGRILYGLFEARRQVSNMARLMVVEGYMDVVALAQHGISYSLATLGTATSTDQVVQMFRLVPQVVFCFDGDEAGRKAAWKALIATLPAMQDGKSVKFLFLPEGDDPDSLVRREGKEQFEARIEQGMNLVDYFFNSLEAGLDMNSLENQARLCKLATPLLRKIPEGVLKHLAINELSRKTGLEPEQLLSVTGLNKKSEPREEPEQRYDAPTGEPPLRHDAPRIGSKLVERAITILLRHPEEAHSLDKELLESLSSDAELPLFITMVQWIQETEHPTTTLLLSSYQGSAHYAYLKSLAEREDLLNQSEQKKEFNGIVQKLISRIKNQLKQKAIKDLLPKRPSELNPTEQQTLRDQTKSVP